MQVEQREAIKTINEQIGAISQQLHKSEDRIDHKIKASDKRLAELTNQCCGETTGQANNN